MEKNSIFPDCVYTIRACICGCVSKCLTRVVAVNEFDGSRFETVFSIWNAITITSAQIDKRKYEFSIDFSLKDIALASFFSYVVRSYTSFALALCGRVCQHTMNGWMNEWHTNLITYVPGAVQFPCIDRKPYPLSSSPLSAFHRITRQLRHKYQFSTDDDQYLFARENLFAISKLILLFSHDAMMDSVNAVSGIWSMITLCFYYLNS